MQVQSLYEEFLSYLSVERNCSPLTLSSYRSDWSVFLQALSELGVSVKLSAITRQVVREYVVWMRKRGLSPATVARRIHSLRSFWNYLWENDYTDTNPFRKLSLPKQVRQLPVYLSEDECRSMIAGAGEQKSALLRCRDTALLTFMLMTGARRSEVLSLRWADVDLMGKTVRFVAAKGHKTRVVPLAERPAAELSSWREVRPASDHDYVFTAKSGARLGRRGLATALQRALKAGGVGKPGTTPHKLRHSFACLMLRSGVDLNCLQRMLGHSRLDTTGVYLQATAEDLRQAISKHPLDIP